MKFRKLIIILLSLALLTSCEQSNQTNKTSPIAEVNALHPYAKAEKVLNPIPFEPASSEELTLFSLAFSPDGQTIYTSTRKDGVEGFYIYTSSFQNGSWSKLEKAPFSRGESSGEPMVSLDGKRIYFSSSVDGTRSTNSQIFMVEKTAQGWSEPLALGSEINTDLNEGAPHLTSEGSLLFYREELRENNYPLTNMMKAEKNKSGFGAATPLNSSINNGIPTYALCMSPDNDYAIFSAPREGSFDLFVSYIENGDFGYPEKLNVRVNTNDKDEVYPTISPDGRYLFFARRTSYRQTMEPSQWESTIYQVDLDAVGIKSKEERNTKSNAHLEDPYKDITFPEVDRNKTITPSKNDIYYEIFVRAFADSDGNGIGDLNGITQNLDYIKDLGATAIWLMPINRSPSYHGYDITDYYSINPDYGTLDDFKHLISEAKKKDIDIIMDLVVNHTGSQHPWFIASSSLKEGPYRYFYKWIGRDQQGYNLGDRTSWGSPVWHPFGKNFYYSVFWSGMPDLNLDSPDVREEIKKIARYWLEIGVSGFRLDAAKHVYNPGEIASSETKDLSKLNLTWWKEFSKACEEVNPNAYIIGEVWDEPEVMAPYYEAFDSTFNFSVGTDIAQMLNSGSDISDQGGFAKKLIHIYDQFRSYDPNFIDAPFLSNHDQDRIMSNLGGDVEKAKLAANIYMTLPGNPFIYYGEEIGMVGTKPDEVIREPFIWSNGDDQRNTSWKTIEANVDTIPLDDQKSDPNSLFNHYKTIVQVRKANPALMSGTFTPLESGNSRVLAYVRSLDNQKAIILHNLSNTEQIIHLENLDSQNLKKLYSSNLHNTIQGKAVTISPLSSIIISDQ